MKTTERNAPAAREPKGATKMFVGPTFKTLFVLAAAAAAAPLLVSCGGAPRSAAAFSPSGSHKAKLSSSVLHWPVVLKAAYEL